MRKNTRFRHAEGLGSGILMDTCLTPDTAKPFFTVDEMLEAGLYMLQSRQAHYNAETETPSKRETNTDLCIKERKWTSYWHRSFAQSGSYVPLAAQLLKARLNRIEREIVLVLLLNHLALLNDSTETCEAVLAQIVLTPANRLNAMRLLSEESRMVRHGIIGLSDDKLSPPKRELILDPMLAEMAMNSKGKLSCGWPVKNEEALYDYLRRLAKAFQKKAESMDDLYQGYGSEADNYKWGRVVTHQMTGLDNALQKHPGWHLSKLRAWMLGDNPFRKTEMWTMFLALLCKELGHVKVEDPLFRGIGLARAACSGNNSPQRFLNCLKSSGELRAEKWIQPCGGTDVFLTDEPHDLEEAEFELSSASLEALGLTGKLAKKRKTSDELTQPKARMEDLVLSDTTQTSLKQAVAQARYFRVLFNDWGLGERIAYGRGVTILFYGPPGTGKTAAAHALAHELGKPILIADYSRLQNCFVGQTEKNIVRIFREARENNAVLFWDEADAMFFERDSASRNWEVRDVNVLLQELERFEGTCVLATNRKTTLDKALERRISLKVGFERPNKAARLEILRRIVPKKLPMECDVDFDMLAAADLSGGEIKNVVLNAARNALLRGGPDARVSMDDFMGAIASAREGSWTKQTTRAIGFTQKG